MKLYSKVSIALVVVVFFSSCLKEINDLKDKVERTNGAIWNPEIALPLVNTSLKLEDVIRKTDNAYVKTNEENVVMLAYRGEVFSQEAADFIKIDNQSFTKDYTLSPSQETYLNTNGSITLQFTEYMDFLVSSDIEIDSMILKVCNNQLRFQSDFQHDVEVTYTFPDVVKNGVPFSTKLVGNYNNAPIDVAQNVNMSGYKFNMSTGPNKYNQIRILVSAKITKVASNPISGNEKISASIYLFYNEYKTLFGYIGQENFMVSLDTLKLDALDKLKNGSFTLDDPRFKLIMHNSLGVPVKADVLALKGYAAATGTTNLTGVPNPLPIPVPNFSQVGQTISDSIVLNKNTSNIATLINNRPSQFIYGFDITANPGGKTVRNFVNDNSKITIEVDIEIPLAGTASNITLEQERTVDFGIDEETEFLDKVLIRMAISNGFPLGVDLQVYMQDSNSKVIDSFLVKSTGFMPPAPVNFSTGRVINSAKNIVDIEFDQRRIENLKKTKSVKIRGELNTTRDNGVAKTVKIYADYELGVKLGVQAKIKFNQKF